MNYQTPNAPRYFLAALPLESERAHRLRHELLLISFVLFALILFGFALGFVLGPRVGGFFTHLLGLGMAVLGAWIPTFLLECFARSARTLVPVGERELLRLLVPLADTDDLVLAFLRSDAGRFAMQRLMLPAVDRYLHDRNTREETTTISSIKDATLVADLAQLAGVLVHADPTLAHLMQEAGVSEDVLVSVVRWYLSRVERDEEKERWWSREHLLSTTSFGRLWAYGRTDTLDRFTHDLTAGILGSSEDVHSVRANELERLFATLSKAQERNVLLVAEPGGGAAEALLAAVASALARGAAERYGGMRLLSMNGTALLSTVKGGGQIESTLAALMNEAVYAGNIIMVFPDFGSFLAEAKRDGVDLSSLLDPYLQSALPIIAITDPGSFHATIELDSELMRRFEKLAIGDESKAELMADVLTAVDLVESRGAPLFTYQAVAELAEAPRYFPSASAHDKVQDLLLELVPQLVAAGKEVVEESDIVALVEGMTHIPVGAAHGPEQGKLLNLEKLLGERVIGQEEGLAAIARALRRARSGVDRGKRPLGSFLFLGPTGVGKTETAKALADIFFGSADRMVRLDMSEYQDDGSVTRLIGSFESGKPGTLASMIRDNPYSVLLVDEFEKASQEVRRLFLQILDEGSFSDASGKPVSLSNNMIIATSNAIADKIFAMVEAKERLEDHRDELINEIVTRGIYAPELLNRFDEVVFYRPLTTAELGQVAKLMLDGFAKSLKAKGITFVVNDAVVRTAMKYGNDPKFGARPMRRAIQDHIEDLVARKIIEGKVKAGDTVNLLEGELV